MANTVAVAITADVADLSVKRAILSSELKAAQKDLNDFAKTASKSGTTTELRASMLASADAAGKARNSIRLIDTELRNMAAPANEATQALAAVGHGSSTVTRELLVLAREAGRGNFTRMAGSATILAGALGFMTPQILGAAAAIAAMAAPFAAIGAAMLAAADDVAKFRNAIQTTGNFAGLTGSAYEAMVQRVATASNTGLGAARGALLALTASGRFTGEEIEQLGRDTTRFSELTGKSSKDVIQAWLKMGEGPTQFAEDFNRTYHALGLAQIEHIANLEREGQKSAATAELVKDLTHWLDEQTVNMGPLAAAWHTLGGAIDGAWEALKRFSTGGTTGQQLADVNAQIALAKRNGAPDGAPVLANLQQRRAALEAVAQAETRSAQTSAAAARTQQDGIDAYQKSHETLLSLRSSAYQATEAVKALHDEMAARVKANPGDAEAKDYYAHQAQFDAALRKRYDKPTPGAATQVEEWKSDLQKMQIASNDFFKDNTAAELAFWQGKLALTAKNSKAQAEVLTEIYNAQKTLAHQAYDEHLAGLEAQAAADRDHLARYRADLQAELDYVKQVQGEESKAYKDKYREIEQADREYAEKMAASAAAASDRSLKALKDRLDAQMSVMETQANSAKTLNSGAGQASLLGPIGNVQADRKNMAIDEQVAQQKLAVEQQIQAAILAADEADIARKAALYGQDSENYKAAVQKKEDDEQQFVNRVQQLTAQMAAQQQADMLKIQQAWNQAITPMVDSFGNGIKGMIEGTENFRTAMRGVADTILGVVISAIERWVAAQLVALIMGQTEGASSSKTQVAAAAGLAGANGVASFAAAPYPIDLLAPAFGAAMYGSALAFGSFDKGTNLVPNDMIAQIHAGERIMPAADNRAMIAAISGSGGSADAAGETHYHHSVTINGVGDQDVVKQLRGQQGEFVRLLKNLHRNGSWR